MLAAAIWHNVLHSPNVNADAGVTALDALTVINELNNRVYSDPDSAGLVTDLPDAQRPPYYDVNCDGSVTALDALLVINTLNDIDFYPGFEFDSTPNDAAQGFEGSYEAYGCHVKLSEGTSLRTELTSHVVLPAENSGVRLQFDTPEFDTSSTDSMQDSFEVTVTDLEGNRVTQPYAFGRTASLNWSEGSGIAAGAAAVVDGGSVSSGTTHEVVINLAHLAAGTEVIVTARLVNNDGDDVSSIVVRDIKPITGLELPPLDYEGEPIDAVGDRQPLVLDNLEDVSSSMQAEYGRTSYTSDRSQVISDLVVTNHGNQAVTGQMIVVLDQFSSVETYVMHPDGLLPDGRPYFDMTSYIDGALAAGASTRSREIRFTNPGEQRFQYRLTTLGDLNVAPSGFDTTPDDKIEAGRTYRYAANAIDEDGQSLTYSVVSGPSSLTIDPDSGELNWDTALEDIGRHSVSLRATDPFGLYVDQSFAIEVLGSLQNRPPNFTTDPVTDAIASSGFEITTVATGENPSGAAVISGFQGPRLVTTNAGDQTLSILSGQNNDRFDDRTTISTGEPRPTDLPFDVGYSVDLGLPQFVSSYDANDVVGMDQSDFNGDGILDLVAMTYRYEWTQGKIRTLEIVAMLGDGDGGFGAPNVIASLVPPSSNGARNLIASDLNGDGFVDVVAVERRSSTLVTILGNGDGTFAPHTETTYDKNISDFRIADIDEDGVVDLVGRTAALGFGASYELMWMRGLGEATFAAPTLIAAAGSGSNCCYLDSVRAADVADLNHDGHIDIAIAGSNTNIQIYHGDGEGNFALAAEMDPPGSAFTYDPDWLRIADFTGDGNLDIAYVHVVDAQLNLFVGDGDGIHFTHQEGASFHRNSSNDAGSDDPVDIDGDGDLDLIFGTTGGDSIATQILLNDGSGQFTRTDYAMFNFGGSFSGNHDIARGGMFGDYNRDGVIDYSYFTSGDDFNGVGIRLGTRPGEFGATRTIPWTDDFKDSEVHPGDFDGDGDLDLLSLRSSQMFLGNGDGTFADPFPAFGVSRAGAFGSIADFNLDGLPDVVATRANTYGSRYFVALANGDGTFEISDDQLVESSFYGYSATRIADFNNDGYPDFIAKTSVERQIDVHLNDPENPGTFQRTFRTTVDGQGVNVSNWDQSFATADFTGDGILDIALADQLAGEPMKLVVFAGDGAGNFEFAAETFAFEDAFWGGLGVRYYSPGDFATADLDEDGRADLVSFTTYGPRILLGLGDGAFLPTDFYSNRGTDQRGRDSYLIDFDQDGHIDMVETGAGSTTIVIHRGLGDGTFEEPTEVGMMGSASQAAFGDLDHDGHLDLTFVVEGAGNYNANDTAIFAGVRDGLVDLLSVDLNGDGNEEVLAINEANDRLKWFVGDSLGNLSRQPDLFTGRAPQAVAAADLDGDGLLEMVTANRASRSISVFSGNVDQGYQATEYAVGDAPIDIATADLNGDDLEDLVVLDEGEQALWVFLSDGTGVLTTPLPIALGDRPGRVVLGDVDGDQSVDAVVTLPDSNRLMILGKIGSASVASPVYVSLSSSPADVSIVDLNSDGNVDLAAVLPGENVVSILYGRGNHQFAKPQDVAVGDSPTRVALTDADEDGRTDLVVTNFGDDTLSVIYNRFDPNEVYRYDSDAIDPDDDTLIYAIVDGPGGLIMDGETGELLWAASPDQVGVHDVTISADDGRGGVATQSFKIDVVPARDNAAPLIATEPVAKIGAGETFDYPAAAIDGDRDALRYRLIDAPAGATIDPTSGHVQWDARPDQAMVLGMHGQPGNIVAPVDPSLKPDSITVEGWYNLHTLPRFQLLMGDEGRNGLAYDVTVVETNQLLRVTLSFDNSADRIRFEVPVSPVTGRWYHVALTYEAATGTATLYVDGVAVGSGTTPNPQPLAFNENADTQIGGRSTSATHAKIDNYRIWNVARTPQQIREGLGRQYENEPHLVLDYRFDLPNTQTVRDYSGAGNHGYRVAADAAPTLTSGLADAGLHSFTIGVEDGRGGFDTQSFEIEIVPELRGSIVGHLFNDLDGDGVQNDVGVEDAPVERSLNGWQLYIDTNANGYPDPSEVSATTDADGNYRLDGLLPGSYPLRILPVAGYETPTGSDVSVSASAETAF